MIPACVSVHRSTDCILRRSIFTSRLSSTRSYHSLNPTQCASFLLAPRTEYQPPIPISSLTTAMTSLTTSLPKQGIHPSLVPERTRRSQRQLQDWYDSTHNYSFPHPSVYSSYTSSPPSSTYSSAYSPPSRYSSSTSSDASAGQLGRLSHPARQLTLVVLVAQVGQVGLGFGELHLVPKCQRVSRWEQGIDRHSLASVPECQRSNDSQTQRPTNA